MAVIVLVLMAALALATGCSACTCIDDSWFPVGNAGCFQFNVCNMTFEDAEKMCNSQHYVDCHGAVQPHLASIHSKEENDAIVNMLPTAINHWDPQVFIGLRLVDDRTPAWTDGTFYDYELWCGSEPNAHPFAYSVISMGSGCNGKWADVHNYRFPFVCKAPCKE